MSEKEASRPNSTQTLAKPAPARPRPGSDAKHEAVPSPKATLEGFRASHQETARGNRSAELSSAVEREAAQGLQGPTKAHKREQTIPPSGDSLASHTSLQEDLSLRLGGVHRAHPEGPAATDEKPAADSLQRPQPAVQRATTTRDWARARHNFPDWAPWAGLVLVLIWVLALVLVAEP